MSKVLLIAGSRDLTLPKDEMDRLIAKHFNVDDIRCVVSGMAKGIDTCGLDWASRHGKPVIKCFPDWKKLGKRAGLSRNEDMAKLADVGIVIHHNSSGSLHMVQMMKCYAKPVVEEFVPVQSD